MLTGIISQAFTGGDYWASISVGIGTSSGTSPVNQYATIHVGGGQNATTSFATQYALPISEPGTYTFYVMGRWNAGFTPTVLVPQAMTLLFIPK